MEKTFICMNSDTVTKLIVQEPFKDNINNCYNKCSLNKKIEKNSKYERKLFIKDFNNQYTCYCLENNCEDCVYNYSTTRYRKDIDKGFCNCCYKVRDDNNSKEYYIGLVIDKITLIKEIKDKLNKIKVKLQEIID